VAVTSRSKRYSTFRRRGVEVFALLVCSCLAIAVTRAEPLSDDRWNVILGVGYLLLAGTVLASLLEPTRLPHLTAYIAVGVIGGPHVFGLVDHASVELLLPVNTLAISLIALAGGLELEAKILVGLLRSLLWSNLVQTIVVAIAAALAFVLLVPSVPFVAQLPLAARFAVAAIWGLLSTSRSPSATLAVLAQTHARGPLASWSLAFVMSSDVLVVVAFAFLLVAVRPWLIEGDTLSSAHLRVLAHEIIGSIALGTCLGLLLIVYVRLVGRQLVLVLLFLGFVVTDGLRYVQFDPLLAFLTTGFVVRNLSNQGEKLLLAVSRMSGIVFVVFFASAGAQLDLPLLSRLWPAALLFFAVRLLATWVASSVATRISRDVQGVRRFSWAPLISQAGLTLALSHTVEREFPIIATGFRSLVIVTVAINEVVGPILFKFALERCRETSSNEATRDSLPSVV
jgi:Kef-type K+ transport system membrane component KefB